MPEYWIVNLVDDCVEVHRLPAGEGHAEIRDLRHNPEPFTISMVSGRKFRIPHPDYAALGRDHSMLVFTATKGRFELIRIYQIECIGVAPSSCFPAIMLSVVSSSCRPVVQWSRRHFLAGVSMSLPPGIKLQIG